ncbi:hypothetical protein FACS1894120_3740 [Clostridia bacterium]|nr:hypothetical protein FACS1894120_3740 [Clostridia bacterium]
MKNSSYVKIVAALTIMSVYIFMFGIMGSVGKDTEGLLLDTADLLAESEPSEPGLTDTDSPLPPTDTEMRLPTYVDYVNPLPKSMFDELQLISIPAENSSKRTATVKEKSPAATRATKKSEPKTTATAKSTATAKTAPENAETIPPRRETGVDEPADDFDGFDGFDGFEDVGSDEVLNDDNFSDVAQTEYENEIEPDSDSNTPVTPADHTGETLTVQTSSGTISDDAFDIISRMVEREMGASFSAEALKAQAVAAYSYVKFANDTNVKPSVAISPSASDKVKTAVRDVFGQAVYQDGKIIQAMYSASSAGHSASAVNVWGLDVPYLRGIETDFDKQNDPNWGMKKSFSSDEISRRVDDVTGIKLSGNPAEWIKILTYVDSVYVGKMEIGGFTSYKSKISGDNITITGRIFREAIMDFDIRSAAFSINYDSASDMFNLVTYGFGHGVGMSQNGANILANNFGYTYDRILKFYYGNVTVG